jgi:hypothetical protein
MDKKDVKDIVWAEIREIWAETDRRWALQREEGERQRAEAERQRAEADRLWEERWNEKMEKLNKQIGGVSNNAGFHAEQFFQDALAKTLTFGGEKYDRIQRNIRISDKNIGVEFDIALINGTSIALIEAKNRIHPAFVKELAEEKIAKFRKLFTEFQNHKTYLGVAGFSFDDTVMEEAKKYGIGIIKQVGESIETETGHLKAY